LIETYGKLWNKVSNFNKTNLEIPLSPPFRKGETGRLNKNISKMPDLVLAGSFHKNLIPLVTDIPKKIKEVSEEYNLPEEKIKMVGFVEQEDLLGWYKNAKLFCYPSLYEGFGLPVLEAMNCGCPIVTSNNSSISEVCSENSAILINPRNTEEIAKAMLSLVTNEKLAREKAVNAKREAEKFSWRKFTENLLQEVENIKK